MAGTEVGNIYFSVDLEDKKFLEGLKNASSEAKKFGKKDLESINSSIDGFTSKLASFAKRTAIVVGGAALAATGFAVKSAADFEQTRIGLENMLGSADKARSMLKDLQKFAAETPFEFPELANAAKQLVAFGFTSGNAMDTVKQLGDVSSAIGAPIGDLAYLMGTLKTQGRAFTIDIRQFAQRGIPIYEYLAKVLKTDEKSITKMVETGKIGFNEVSKAFQAMTGEGGKFQNAMAKQSKSLTGLWSTFRDSITMAGMEIVGVNNMGDIKKGSIFDVTRNAVAKLIQVINQNLPIIIPKIQEFFNKAVEAGKNLATWIMDNKDNIIDIFTTIGGAIFGTVKFFVEHKNALFILMGAYAVFKATMVAMNIINLISNISNMFGAAKLAISRVTTAITGQSGIINALKLLVATPGVAYAIIIAIGLSQVKKAIDLINDLENKLAELELRQAKSRNATSQIKSLYQKGKISKEEYKKRLSAAAEEDRLISEAASKQASMGGFWNGFWDQMPQYANGVQNFGGGLAVVGERGPELVNLPKGADVIPNGVGSNVNINIDMNGVMASSRTDVREIGRTLVRAINDELRSKGQQEITI